MDSSADELQKEGCSLRDLREEIEEYYTSFFNSMIDDYGVLVLDQKSVGFSIFKTKGIIYINPYLKIEHKFCVLLHEIGHIFTGKMLNLKRRKKPSTEAQATQYALKTLKSLGFSGEGYNEFLKYAKETHIDEAYYGKRSR